MSRARITLAPPPSVPPFPTWARARGTPKNPEDTGFLAGATLAALLSLSDIQTRMYRPERACEVAFYLGTFYLERRDRAEARHYLEAAVNACSPSLIELGAAKAELTRLQSGP